MKCPPTLQANVYGDSMVGVSVYTADRLCMLHALKTRRMARGVRDLTRVSLKSDARTISFKSVKHYFAIL
jgi:hypothetical protein